MKELKTLKTWDELTISDNFIFQAVMNNSQICKEFLEKLLGISIRKINYVEPEKIFDVGIKSKGIRLDVYAEDENHTIYDIEMQTTNTLYDSLVNRTRYYQSLMVANMINKGQDYQDLNKTFIIFVCTFDLFKENRKIYTFKNLCLESRNLELNDGSTIIFLNAKGINGKLQNDIKNFLNFINGEPAKGKFTKKIAFMVDEVKRNDRLKVGYMSWYAEEMRIRRLARIEGKAEGKIEGKIEGKAEGIVEMIKNFLSVGTPIDLIIKASGWTKEKILDLAKKENIKLEEI